MQRTIIGILMILLTIAVFWLMNRLYRRVNIPLLIPILTSTACLIALLISFHIPYQTYMIGGGWISKLLGPAVVALAYPLYKQRAILAKNLVPIVGGVGVGSIVGIMSGLLFARLFGVDRELIFSMVPKSVTTPVAMSIASELGGNPAITIVFVMIAGIGGVVIGPYILDGFRIKSTIGRGIALGSASHAIGTSKAFEYGEEVATVSSVAMTLSAISASLFAPLLVLIFY